MTNKIKRIVPADPGHQAMVDHWCREWAARHGERYPFGGRDAKCIKELRTRVGDDVKLAVLIIVYLDLDDAWIKDKGQSLPVMAAHLPQVMQAARPAPSGLSSRLKGLATWALESPRQK